MLTVAQAAFAVAFSGGLRMAPSPLDKQPAGYKSPHNWLVRLGMDLAVLRVMWSRN